MIFPGSYLNGKPGVARVTIHKEVSPKGKEVEQLKKEVFDIIESELITYEN